jgi:SAM-dependent methyltransferase
MSREPIAADWATARGEKWRSQLAGLEAMLRPIDEPLIRALDLSAPYRIADVGCGGGATTLEVWGCAPPGGVVHGFDVSPALVEVARSRMPSTDGTIAFEIADMGRAAPPDGPYHRLLSRFGIMFFDDPPAAFANLRRWLVPGGRFAFAVWGPVADNAWMTAIRRVVAEIVDLPPIDPASPGPFRYGDVTALLATLQAAGFVALDVTDWRGMLPIGDRLAAADAAHFALASFSSFAELLSDAGGDALPVARRALSERFAAHEQDGRVTMSARVHIVTGTADVR